MKDILIIAHFCSDFDGKGNNRFNYLAKLLTDYQCKVELVTTDFSHSKKKQRENIESGLPYKLTMISEPGYKKNVSIKRFYSHYVMGKNLKDYLSKREKPDIIYCGVPSLDAAKAAARYANKNEVRFIIDIQDLWPEAFKMVFNLPVISNLIFYPMKKTANYIYGLADDIIAVSKTYVDRAINVNRKCKNGYPIYIGTNLNNFDSLVIKNKITNKLEDELWLAYIGTLGHSYDIRCVIDALSILKANGMLNIKFIIMGDGPLRSELEEYAKNRDIYCDFTGSLSYDKMVGVLSSCDIAVNPISHGAAGSIINKHGDYAAAGLPVINTQECLEYRKLVENYNMGYNCENSNPEDLADKLLILYSDKKLRETMGQNSRRLAEDKFDRNHTYSKIVQLILQ